MIDESKIYRSRELYSSYINTHVMNVKIAYTKYIPVLHKILKFSAIQLKIHLDTHDESKYSEEEFEPYRKRFFPADDSEALKDGDIEFENAWKHHYSVNLHHPEWWICDNEPTEMQDIYLAEMILDWVAMGMYNHNNIYDYYEKNKDEKKKIMHPNTIQKLEKCLDAMKQFDKDNNLQTI